MKIKIILLITTIVLLFQNTDAQVVISQNQVPQDVFISFKYKYPDALLKSWQSESGNYVAVFDLNNQEGKAKFTAGGKWISTHFPIAEKEMPSSVITYFKENYKEQFYVIQSSELVKNDAGENYYLLVIKKSGLNQPEPTQLFFDLSGKFIKKIEPEEEIEIDVKEEQKEMGGGADNLSQDPNKTADPQKDQNQSQNQINSQNTEQVNTGEKQNSGIKLLKPDDEVIPDKKVPANVKSAFAAKNKKATDIKWYRVERDYLAKFTLGGQSAQSTVNEDGIWLETRIGQDESSLRPTITDYLKKNHRKKVITHIDFVTANKDKYYEIQMIDKAAKEMPDAPITFVWFDANGKFRNEEIPVNDDDYASEIEKIEQEDKDFLSTVDNNLGEFNQAQNTDREINVKGLPTVIIDYIKNNYSDYSIKTTMYLFDDDLNQNVYYITIKKEGFKEITELYFDILGKFLKKIDPLNKNIENEFSDDEYNLDDNNDQNPVNTGENINPKDLPSGINMHVKDYYPDHKIREAYYKYDESMGNIYHIILKRQGDKTLVHLYFDLNGEIVKTEQSTE